MKARRTETKGLVTLGRTGALALGLGAGIAPAMAADCFTQLDIGSQAQQQGDLQKARLTFEQALAIAECREPPHGDLLRFSLGRVLLEMAADEPRLACEARPHLTAAGDSDDESIAAAAGAALDAAEGPCAASRAADDRASPRPAAETLVEAEPPAVPANTPPSEEPTGEGRIGERSPVEPEPPRDASPTPPATPAGVAAEAGSLPAPTGDRRRLTVGPRVDAGISGIAAGGFTVGGEFDPGATVGLGVALHYRLSDGWAAVVEPGVTFTSIAYSVRLAESQSQSVTWRRTIAEALIGAAWSPSGGDFALRGGVRAGWVFDAVEVSADGDSAPSEPWAAASLDGVLGAAYGWDIGPSRLRVSIDASLSALPINGWDDTAGFHGYRSAIAVASLF